MIEQRMYQSVYTEEKNVIERENKPSFSLVTETRDIENIY